MLNPADPMRGLVISAPSSGAGKTTVTLGLLRALRDRGVDVASAKSGPDYIDPAFHEAATGRPCLTLDAWAAPAGQLRARARAASAEMLVIEGAMGLFDGAATPGGGAGSTADLAEALDAPILLVLDCARMGQTAGALVEGLARHSPGLKTAGVVLNRVGSERHLKMVREAVEPVAPVLGALPPDAAISLPSRHLGLVQAGEHQGLEAFITAAAELVNQNCDLDRISAAMTPLAAPSASGPSLIDPPGQRIAIARDLAFSFIYPHLLSDWRRRGAELTFFSPLADEAPSASADAVFLPGGYPELHGPTLAGAQRFAAGMAALAERALIYGECGGYMVLGEGMVDGGGHRHRMLGLLPLETSFATPRRHLGYRRLTPVQDTPWPGPAAGHEFHYAETLRADGPPLFQATDAGGVDLGAMGLRRGNIMGSFAHIIENA